MPGSIRALRRRADPVRGGGRIPLVKKRTAGRPQFRTAGTDTLSAQEERIADTVEAAFTAVPQQTLLDSLERRDEAGYALAVLNALSDAQGRIQEVLLASFVSSGETSAVDLGRELSRQYRQVGKADTPSPSEVALRFRFNATDPRATAWAQAEAGRLITNMAASEREMFRALVEQSFVESRTVGTTASSIFQQLQTVTPTPTARDFGQSIGANLNGLTERYERAVMNRVASVADDLAARGITGEKALERMRKEGDKYATKLRRTRSRTIARTERMMAHNQARLLSYQQAIDSGLMSREYSRKVWSTGPFDVCPICVAMSGVEAKVADPFTLPNGAQVQAPPGHPNCRCTLQTRTDTTLYDPPRALGTGEPGDPFRIGRPGFSAEGERLRGIRLPSVPVPTATAVPQPPPPEPPLPPSPLRVDVDDLRDRVDTLKGKTLKDVMETDADGNYVRTRATAPAQTIGETRLNAYDMVPTRQAEDALDATLEAGERALDQVEREIARRTAERRQAVDLDRLEQRVREAGEARNAATRMSWTAERQAVLNEITDTALHPTTPLTARAELMRLRNLPEDELFRFSDGGSLRDEVQEALAEVFRQLPDDHPAVEDLLRDLFLFPRGTEVGDAVEDVARYMMDEFGLTISEARTGNQYRFPSTLAGKAGKRTEVLEAQRRLDELKEAILSANSELELAREATSISRVRVEVLEEVLSASRAEFGTGTLRDKFTRVLGRSGRDSVSRKEVREALDQVAVRMPKEWSDAIFTDQEIGFVKRGYYNLFERRLRVSGPRSGDAVAWTKGSWQSVLHHEVQHATQGTQPTVRLLERILLSRRAQQRAATEGESFWKMERIYKGDKEWYLDVGLGEKYMMKHYPGQISSVQHDGFTELSTRGMERLWYEDWETTDRDVLRLMLGMLLLA